MPTQPNIILGLSPGTRSTGYAIASNGELIDWGEKYFKGSWNNHSEIKFHRFMVKLLNDYHITTIALKRNNPSKSSSGLERLHMLIRATTNRFDLKFKSLSIKELNSIMGNAKNKRDSISRLQKRFPILQFRTNRQNQYKKYEAIIIALL